jgi:hypothetical protein
MLKIYASGIKDLTVARYFAAMQVDLAGFELTFETLPAIKAIKEWIEGPRAVAEPADNLQEVDANELFLQSGMDYRLKPIDSSEKGLANTIHMLPYGEPVTEPGIFVINVDTNNNAADFDAALYAANDQGQFYFDISHLTDEWLSLLSGYKNFGLLIRAGHEDRPGIKSFDTLDVLFDKLESQESLFSSNN